MNQKPELVPHWVIFYYDDGTWWTSGPYADKLVADDYHNSCIGVRLHVYKRKVMLPLIKENKR